MNIAAAMQKLRPGASWVADPETYEGLKMTDGSEKPSREELRAASDELAAVAEQERTAKQSSKETLKAQWKALKDGTGTQAERLRRVELALAYVIRHELRLMTDP